MENHALEDYIRKRHGVVVEHDVPYGEAGIAHGRAPTKRALLLDIYRPDDASDRARPAIVFAFGGAFHRGSRVTDTVVEGGHQNTPVSEYCREFAKRGYVCFSIDYRLTPEDPDPGVTPMLLRPQLVNRDRIDHVRGIMGLPPSTPTMVANAIEAAIDDMAAAIQWVHDQAERLGVDPDRIAAGGFSAGGTAALAATYGERSPARAVIALSGSMGIAEMRTYLRSSEQAPAILFRGEHDLPGLGPISHQLHVHLQSVGVDHECYVVPAGTHFYLRTAAVLTAEGAASTVEDVMCAFLARTLLGTESV